MINKLSNVGKRHYFSCTENQDAVCSGENKHFAVVSLADGVSSCNEARAGAETASRAVTNLFLKKGNYFLEFNHSQITEMTLSHILYELNLRAKRDGKDVEEYSSTIASVLYDKKKKRLLYFNLGDSIILAVSKEKCRVLSMPADSSSGCCVTTTKHASLMTEANVIDSGTYKSVIICTDGAWKCMFAKNRIKSEVVELLGKGEFEGLKNYLTSQDCPDDYSFVSIDIPCENRRRIA